MKKASAKKRLLSKDGSETDCSDEDYAGPSAKSLKLKVGEMMADVVVKEEDDVFQHDAGVSSSPDDSPLGNSYLSDVVVKDELVIKEEPMSAEEDVTHDGSKADLTSTSSFLASQQSLSSAIESEANSSFCGNKRKDRQRQYEGRAVRDAAAESLRTSETELLTSENENLQGDTFFGTADDNANVFEIICSSPRTYQWSTIGETTHPSCSTNMDAIPETTSRSVPLRTSAVLSVANSGAVRAATSAAVLGTTATVPRTTSAALPETTAETANPETTNVPIRTRKRGGDPIKAQVTRYIQQRNVEDRADKRKALELEEKKIGLEERRLELEDRKLRIEEQKMELLLKSSDRRDQTEVVILGIMERLVEKLNKI